MSSIRKDAVLFHFHLPSLVLSCKNSNTSGNTISYFYIMHHFDNKICTFEKNRIENGWHADLFYPNEVFLRCEKKIRSEPLYCILNQFDRVRQFIQLWDSEFTYRLPLRNGEVLFVSTTCIYLEESLSATVGEWWFMRCIRRLFSFYFTVGGKGGVIHENRLDNEHIVSWPFTSYHRATMFYSCECNLLVFSDLSNLIAR